MSDENMVEWQGKKKTSDMAGDMVAL
jgi:hypothetical protein